MSAPPFFQSVGRGDLKFWGEDDGPTVIIKGDDDWSDSRRGLGQLRVEG